ncbi:MAG: 3-keto-disaccharide hydrolase [Gemmatimonadota bacterium]
MNTQNQSDWITLFDGRDASAWRGYLKQDLPAGWQIVGGELTRVDQGGDIITKDTFENFDLTLDWKVMKGGNSGIFFGVKEDASLPAVYYSGPEMQVLDNVAHRDGLDPRTSAGSNYALHQPIRDVTKPVGEWNSVRLIVNRGHVEHWLNGLKLLEYELWSDDWKRRVAESKFKEMPEYGLTKRGHIALQDHGDRVAFRNIRIRRLD